jgi:hypothetical protein
MAAYTLEEHIFITFLMKTKELLILCKGLFAESLKSNKVKESNDTFLKVKR